MGSRRCPAHAHTPTRRYSPAARGGRRRPGCALASKRAPEPETACTSTQQSSSRTRPPSISMHHREGVLPAHLLPPFRCQVLLPLKLGGKARLQVGGEQGVGRGKHVLILQRAAEAQAQQRRVPQVQNVAAGAQGQGRRCAAKVGEGQESELAGRNVRGVTMLADTSLYQKAPWREHTASAHTDCTLCMPTGFVKTCSMPGYDGR